MARKGGQAPDNVQIPSRDYRPTAPFGLLQTRKPLRYYGMKANGTVVNHHVSTADGRDISLHCISSLIPKDRGEKLKGPHPRGHSGIETPFTAQPASQLDADKEEQVPGPVGMEEGSWSGSSVGPLPANQPSALALPLWKERKTLSQIT